MIVAAAAAVVLRIAVVPAGAALAEADGAAPFDVRVATIEEAVAAAEKAVAAAGEAPAAAGSTPPRIEITLAGAVHEVRGTVRIPAGLPPCSLVGADGARVVGGVVHRAAAATPCWEEPDDAMRARVAVEARAHLRVWRLPAGARAQLAGPVHSGLGIDTPAVHSELFVGGRALTLARWPSAGYAEIATVVDAGSVPRNAMPDITAAKRVVEPDRGGVFVPADTRHVARWGAGANSGGSGPDAPPSDPSPSNPPHSDPTHSDPTHSNLWALGYWNWDWAHEQLPIASVDEAAGTVRLGMPHRYGLAQRGRFCVLNAPGELDAEGEYWIDRAAGCVYAWLPAGAASAEAAVSLAGAPLLALEGVADFTVRGVSFECTRGGAIAARGCERVRLEACGFRNIGTRAVSLDGRANLVARCVFTDIGGEGVELTGGDRPSLARGDNSIEDCTFRECGRLLRSYHPAVRMEGVGNRVSRCAFIRHPHIALWFRGNDHLIEANEFSEVVYETGDAGAIYCGRDWTAQGTVVRGNLFRDIRGSDARYQNGVYLDDMSSGITVEDNVFVRCNWGVLVGGGRDNTLRRNTFVACAKAVSWDARGVGWMAPSIADPATSTLHRSYAAVPVDSEPWRSRYPHLGDYLTFDFGRPVRGVLAGSHLIGTPLGRIDDRKRVVESGTLSEPGEGAALAARAEDTVRAWRAARGD